MDGERTPIIMEIPMKANTDLGSHTVEEPIYGTTAESTRESSKMERSMGKENGQKGSLLTEQLSLALIRMIKK